MGHEVRATELTEAGAPERGDELPALRERLRSLPRPPGHGSSEARLAREIFEVRGEIVRVIGSVEACRSCAADASPAGTAPLPGGRCCDQRVEKLFADTELAVLRAGGCDPESLVGPCTEGAGCAFRGPLGCVLPPEYRPSPCVGYVCDLLAEELRQRGRFEAIRDARHRLEGLTQRFSAVRAMQSLLKELQALI